MRNLSAIFLLFLLILPQERTWASDSADGAKTVALVREAQSFFMQKQFYDAEAKCKDALYINPRYFPAYNLLGNIFSLQKGKETQAINYFKRSLEIYPHQKTVYTRLSFLYNREGNYAESANVLEAGLARYPDDYSMNFNLGLAYLVGMNNPQKAMPYLEKAKKLDSRDVRIFYLEGVAKMMTGHVPEALDDVTEMRRRNEPYLAAHLEDMIRREGMGGKINPLEVASVFSRRANTKVVDLDAPPTPGTNTSAGKAASPSVIPSGAKTKIKLHGKPVEGKLVPGPAEN